MNEFARDGRKQRWWGFKKGLPISESDVRKVALYGRESIEGNEE